MQMMAPPEDALQERFARIDERFDRTDERIVDVDKRVIEAAKETDRRLGEVDRRITETKEEVKELKQEMKALQNTFQRGNFALVASGRRPSGDDPQGRLKPQGVRTIFRASRLS